jgi:carbonic anhydrase
MFHMAYKALGCFVGCSDARVADIMEEWIFNRYGVGLVDRVIFPGSTAEADIVLKAIKTLYSLHTFPELCIAHHTDCGALSGVGKSEHVRLMTNFAHRVHEALPDVTIQLLLAHTDEQYIEVVQTLYEENSYKMIEQPE